MGRKPPPLNRSKSNLAGRSGPTIPLVPTKFNLDRYNVSPLRGEKPQNRPVSKRNTGRAALRADPAGNKLETKAMTTSSQCNTGRMCVILPIITRENTSLARGGDLLVMLGGTGRGRKNFFSSSPQMAKFGGDALVFN